MPDNHTATELIDLNVIVLHLVRALPSDRILLYTHWPQP